MATRIRGIVYREGAGAQVPHSGIWNDNLTMLVKLYTAVMKAVKVAELKAKLSAHLRYVRNGEEVIVCDRDKPIARISPIRADEHSERMQRLIARGIVDPPAKRGPNKWPQPPGNVSAEAIERMWREDREGR
jgi:antitoxin (DNA-binding transcriptional repressor) of toxin-antitoxin stability system